MIKIQPIRAKPRRTSTNESGELYEMLTERFSFPGVESAHSGEALLPDVSYNSSSGPGRTPKQKKSRRGENTPLIRGVRSSRNRSEYEDLDDETFNNWPRKLEVSSLSHNIWSSSCLRAGLENTHETLGWLTSFKV